MAPIIREFPPHRHVVGHGLRAHPDLVDSLPRRFAVVILPPDDPVGHGPGEGPRHAAQRPPQARPRLEGEPWGEPEPGGADMLEDEACGLGKGDHVTSLSSEPQILKCSYRLCWHDGVPATIQAHFPKRQLWVRIRG